MRFKRKSILCMVCLCCIFWIYFFCSVQAEAAEKDSFGFDENGNFIMVTRDQAATSKTTYRTIGWTMKRYDVPIQNNETIRMNLVSTGESKIDPENPEYVYHYFICTKDMIFSKIEQCSKEWLYELYVNGGYVYFDAVMTVAENDVPLGSMDSDGNVYGMAYFTYEEISAARNWLDSEALRTHFDKKVYFPENKEMLYGNYEVHYMELTEEKEIPLAYLGLEIEKGELKEERKEFEPEDVEEDLKYVQTKIIYKKYRQNEKTKLVDRKFTIDNTELDYKYIKIYYYFIREEQIEEKVISYGNEMAERNRLAISAEEKDSPRFDVKRGIPASEQLRIDGTVQKYTYRLVCEKHSGIRMVPVDVTVIYSVLIQTDEGTKLQNVTEEKTCYVPRNYSYYKIKDWEVYYADSIVVNNYSFPEEQVEIRGFYEPKIERKQQKESYIFLPKASVSIYGGIIGEGVSSILKGNEILQAAERACGKINVINDTFSIDSESVLENGPFEEHAKEPKEENESRMCTIQEGQIYILPNKRNGIWESSAKITYHCYGRKEEKSYDIVPVNEVVIHTPVVCDAGTSDEIAWNQQIQPTKYHSLILGRDFRISISSYGNHSNIPGYGKTDYSKYTKNCQVKFPFEVYDGEQLLPKEHWIDLEINRLSAKSFYLPVGVDEGKYEILFRTLASNYDFRQDEGKLQKKANFSKENYGAMDKITVWVLGRIYGLEITDIVDHPRWTNVFYQSGGAVRTEKTYRIGKNNCNGEKIRGISEANVFPILSGSHPFNALAGAVRLGYRVKFRCKTIGTMYGKEDRLALKASYYYIDEQGKNRQQVEIYRKKDLEKIEQIITLTESNRRFQAILTRNVENKERQDNSLQIWEGEYRLNPDIFLVPYGTDLKKYIQKKGGRIRKDDHIFLKKGYLLVQFMIRTVSQGKPHLDYINAVNAVEGYCNMWKSEGFFYHRVDNHGIHWEFENGDMLLFDRSHTIYDDYQTVGTH